MTFRLLVYPPHILSEQVTWRLVLQEQVLQLSPLGKFSPTGICLFMQVQSEITNSKILHCKQTFIPDQENQARFAEALQSSIFLIANSSLSYGCKNKTDLNTGFAQISHHQPVYFHEIATIMCLRIKVCLQYILIIVLSSDFKVKRFSCFRELSRALTHSSFCRSRSLVRFQHMNMCYIHHPWGSYLRF